LCVGRRFPDGLYRSQPSIRCVSFSIRIRWPSRLTNNQDVPAFVAIIIFSHPWRRDILMSTIHRTMCQDSTAYFLSVLSIQIFATVAVSSGAAVSLNV